MSARILQREPGTVRPIVVALSVQRGGVAVYPDEELPLVALPIFAGVGLLAWSIALPAVVPASGAWTFVSTELSRFVDQTVGTAHGPTGMAELKLTAGVLNTTLPIAAGDLIHFRGLVN